jgi:UPF0716 protein FxsA
VSLYAFVLFIVAPLAEIASIVVVAEFAGWWTLLALAASAVLGSYVLRLTGRGWMRSLRREGPPAGRTAGDSALLFAAGLLLISPGFLSDIVGLLLLLPFVRVLLRGAVTNWFVARFSAVTGAGGFTVWQRRGSGLDPRIIRGEVVREDVPPPDGPPGPQGSIEP